MTNAPRTDTIHEHVYRGVIGLPGKGRRLSAPLAALTALAALAVAAPFAGATAATPPFTIESTSGGWAPSGTINPLTQSAAYFGPFQLLPLAYYEEGSGTFFPELASSWKLSGHTFTVHIRPTARWSTGKPVTAYDVKDSILLGDLGYGPDVSAAGQVAAMTIPNSHTIVFQVPYPGTFTEEYVLGMTVLPASVYGRQLTPYIQALAAEATTNPQAEATLKAAYETLAAENIKSLPSNGPYVLKQVTSSAALLTKNPDFFGAARVQVPEVEFLNVLNAAAGTADLQSGQVDFSTNTQPTAVMQQWKATRVNGIVQPANAQTAVFFNAGDYPWNMVQVRQAFAYLINRSVVTRVSTPGGYQAADNQAGHPGFFLKEWLSPAQMKSLNTYAYNPAEGIRLLEQAGFKRGEGGWLMPNGKPFDVTISVDSSFATWVLAGNAMAQMLDRQGIHAQVNQVSGSVYFPDAALKSSFSVFLDFSSVVDAHPVASWGLQSWPVVTGYELQSGVMVKKLPGLGYPVVESVPGLGRVNTNQVLATLLTNATTAVQRKDDDIFARLMSYELPYMSLWTKYEPIMYSGARYTGWPKASDPLWTDVPLHGDMGLVILLQTGTIHPR